MSDNTIPLLSASQGEEGIKPSKNKKNIWSSTRQWGLGATLTIALSAQALAQQTIDIPAQSLAEALNKLGEEAGLQIIYDANLVTGINSKAVQAVDPTDVLRQLLAGTGIRYTISGNSVTLLAQEKESQEVRTLPPVQIASTPLGATTEGTGSYTTGATNSSTGIALSLRETPQSITVITHDRMKDQNLDEIQDVINQTVGIENASSGSLGSDGSTYYARGFRVNNYMIDGVPRPAYIYGFREEVNDMIAYDRVEIIRGPSGLMTGRGSPAASINLIRKKPTDHFQATITAEAGSWDRYRLETDLSGSLTSTGDLRGRLAAATEDKDSFIDRINTERQAVYGILEKDIGDHTTVSIGVDYLDFQNDGAPRGALPLFYTDGTETDFSRSTNNATNWAHFARESTNVFISGRHAFSPNWTLNVNAEHKDGSYRETIGYVRPTPFDRETGAGAILYIANWGADTEIDSVSANLQGKFQLFNREHDLAVTLTKYEYQTEGPNGPFWRTAPEYAPSVNAYDIFATGQWPQPDLGSTGGYSGDDASEEAASAVVRLHIFDPFAVIAGARVSDWEQSSWDKTDSGEKTTTPGAEEHGVVTPYLGLTYDFNRHFSAYASYTTIFEPQTQVDINDRVLDPLEGNGYEAGLKAEYLNGRLNASISAYRIEQDNLAVSDGVGVLSPSGARAYHEADGTESEGIELEISGQLLPGWQVAGGFSHNTVKDNEGQQLYTFVPNNSFKLFSSYHLRGDLEGLTLGGNLRWQDEAVAEEGGPNGEDYVQDSVVLVDVMAKYVFPQNITATININNLFDKEYLNLFYNTGRYGEPRNFNLAITYDF